MSSGLDGLVDCSALSCFGGPFIVRCLSRLAVFSLNNLDCSAVVVCVGSDSVVLS